MFRRRSIAAVVVLALASSATGALPAAAKTHTAVVTHKLIVSVKTNLAPAAEKKFAVLVLIRQARGAPAGAIATAGKPLAILLAHRGLYRVKAEIDSCKGSCDASYRISASANHKVQIVPTCQPNGSGFVCSRVRFVKVF